MIESISSPVFVQSQEPSAPAITSWKSRSVTCDKLLVLTNTAVILVGIATAFFAKMPLLVLGLGAYGLFYLFMNAYSERKIGEAEREKLQEVKSDIQARGVDVGRLKQTATRIRGEVSELRKERGQATKDDVERVQQRSEQVAQLNALIDYLTVELPKARAANQTDVINLIKGMRQVMRAAVKEMA